MYASMCVHLWIEVLETGCACINGDGTGGVK